MCLIFSSRLYLVLEEHIRDSPSPVLWSLGLSLLDFNVVNMELSTTALQSHLLKLTLRIEHPEYAVRHRALMVDRTFFEKQIEGSKVHVNNVCMYVRTYLKSGIPLIRTRFSIGIHYCISENVD